MSNTRNILVVDDDPGVRKAVGRALAFEGYDVDEAALLPSTKAASDGAAPVPVSCAVPRKDPSGGALANASGQRVWTRYVYQDDDAPSWIVTACARFVSTH